MHEITTFITLESTNLVNNNSLMGEMRLSKWIDIFQKELKLTSSFIT